MVYGWRNTGVYPGDRVYFSFPKGTGGFSAPTLPSGWTFFWPSKIGTGSDWHRSWAWGINIASNATPGDYTIATPSDGNLTVTVLAAPTPRPVKYVSKLLIPYIQTYLNSGYDLEIAPGRHNILAEINVPAGATIKSGGAHLVRQSSGSYAERMFVPAGGMTLEGLTLDHEIPDSSRHDGVDVVYIHTFPYPAGQINVRKCTILRGNLTRSGPEGMLVEQCKFNKGQAGEIANSAVWYDNDFYGPTALSLHSFFMGNCVGSFILSNRWHGTTRGIVSQTGATVGCVFMDLMFEGIRGGELNANEVILFEAGLSGEITPDSTHGIRDNLFLDIFINDCAGPGLILFGSGMHDNIFWSVDIHTDCEGIYLAAFGSGTIGPNAFTNIQSTGRLRQTGACGSQVLTNVQFIESLQRRGTAGPFAATYAALNDAYPLALSGQVNTYSTCGFLSKDRVYQPITSGSFVPA